MSISSESLNPNVDEIAQAVAYAIADLAREFLGEPNNSSNATEYRYRGKDSLSVIISGAKQGQWFDHEAGEGGGPLQFIEQIGEISNPIPWAKERFFAAGSAPAKTNVLPMRPSAGEGEPTEAERIVWAQSVSSRTKPLKGTAGEAYLNSRGIQLMPPDDVFRFLPATADKHAALVGIMRDKNGQPHFVQRIFLDGARKAEEGKRSLGVRNGNAIKLPAATNRSDLPLVLSEGPETGLSVWQATGYETWITAGVNGLVGLKISSDEYSDVIIAADGDEPDSAARKTVDRAIADLETRGIRVRLALAPPGEDFNDLTQSSGDHFVAEAINQATAPDGLAGEDLTEALSKFGQHDTGAGLRFLYRCRDDFLHVYRIGWHAWDGRRFVEDAKERRIDSMQDVADRIADEARFVGSWGSKEHKDRLAFANKSHNRREIENGIAVVKGRFTVEADELDTDPFLFNVRNGTIDLKSGTLRRHNPNDRITKAAPVDYDPAAECPTWMNFLSEIFGQNLDAMPEPNDDQIEGLQRAIGYSLTGDVSERQFWVLYGPTGANGKSTMLNVLESLLGDYATPTNAETFMIKDTSRAANNDVARLRGARFVPASESDRHRRLSEALIKQLTGRDTVTARFLNKENFTFTPQFKIFLATNYKPEISGTDDAIWDRINVIPFNQKFYRRDDPDRPAGRPVQDPYLEDTLREELPGILNWAVEGCLKWQRSRLSTPASWRVAKDAYRTEQDTVGQFLEEMCSMGAAFSVASGDLYAAYTDWIAENGMKPLSQKNLGQQLKKRPGLESRKGGGGRRLWTGLMLLSK